MTSTIWYSIIQYLLFEVCFHALNLLSKRPGLSLLSSKHLNKLLVCIQHGLLIFFPFQSTIKLLVAAGANVDLQTGSYRGNVTALMLAAAKGHLDVVKGLVELKVSPDKKGRMDLCGCGVLEWTKLCTYYMYMPLLHQNKK